MPKEQYLLTLDRPDEIPAHRVRLSIDRALRKIVWQMGELNVGLLCTVRRDTSKDEGV